MKAWGYYWRTAWSSVRTTPGVSLLTVATLVVGLLIIGIYFTVLETARGLPSVWGRTADINVFLDLDIKDDVLRALPERVRSIEGVRDVRVLSPADIVAQAQSLGPEMAQLFSDLDPSLLPITMEVGLETAHAELTRVQAIARQLLAIDGVTTVDYGGEELTELQNMLDILRGFGLVLGFMIALGTAFIVSNTIRLAVYARREEISILKLVGATDWFVRWPFLIEGVIWGTTGAVAALGLLVLLEWLVRDVVDRWLLHHVGPMHWVGLMPNLTAGLLVFGLFIGLAGSYVAVRRFLGLEAR